MADGTRRAVLAGAGALGLGASFARAASRGAPRVMLHTAKGDIVVEVEPQRAPLTSANFLHYVDTKAYENGTFYRAARTPGAPREGSIVGGPAKGVRPFPPIAHESTTMTGLKHLEGTLSLGRFAPGTATDNFFICASAEPYLDAHPGAKGDNLGYAAFGQVVEGLPIVHKILALPTSSKSQFADQRGQWLKTPVPFTMRRV
jgi:peptidyl-prolyl cis-trans isomerase A (cyclophilin A)